jgi:catechol 2,3-dioxygenase-like lactoylglutathione lyase family enzyme
VIRDVPLTGVFVNDQEAALDFYTNKLGLEKIQDEPYGPDARWITVSPRGARIEIVLEKAQQDHEKALVGRSDGAPVLVLSTDDIHAAYERLRERGVRFLEEPVRYPWAASGRGSWIRTAVPSSCSRRQSGLRVLGSTAWRRASAAANGGATQHG